MSEGQRDAPPGTLAAVLAPPRARTRSETLEDIGQLKTDVAVTQTRLDGLLEAVTADKGRRPTAVAVLAVAISAAALLKPCVMGTDRASKGDLAEVRVEATTQARELEARVRALELALRDLRAELRQEIADAIKAAESPRDAPGRRRPR